MDLYTSLQLAPCMFKWVIIEWDNDQECRISFKGYPYVAGWIDKAAISRLLFPTNEE